MVYPWFRQKKIHHKEILRFLQILYVLCMYNEIHKTSRKEIIFKQHTQNLFSVVLILPLKFFLFQVSQLREAISILPNVTKKSARLIAASRPVPSTAGQNKPRTGPAASRTVPTVLSPTAPTVHLHMNPANSIGKPSPGYIAGTIRSSLIIKTKE